MCFAANSRFFGGKKSFKKIVLSLAGWNFRRQRWRRGRRNPALALKRRRRRHRAMLMNRLRRHEVRRRYGLSVT